MIRPHIFLDSDIAPREVHSIYRMVVDNIDSISIILSISWQCSTSTIN